MAKQLSKAAIAKRTAKAQATREAKKKAALEQLGLTTERKKIRKVRKPMTAEQKAAAAERLAKARAAKGPAKNSTFDSEVAALPDDHPFSLKNVKQWHKVQKDVLASIRRMKDSKDASERNYYNEVSVYVYNLEQYMRTGVYMDFKAGDNMEKRITQRCLKMAYHADGTPKRTVGVWYPDIGEVYEGDNG